MNSLIIPTYSGGRIDLLNLESKDILLTDIVWPLAKICNYGGKIQNFRRRGIVEISHYSMAEKSVLLAELMLHDYPDIPELAFQALMYNSVEAYIGTLQDPIKSLFPEFQTIEQNLQKIIFKKFGIQYPINSLVQDYIYRVNLSEKKRFFEEDFSDFQNCNIALKFEPRFLPPEEAYCAFLHFFGKLRHETDTWTIAV